LQPKIHFTSPRSFTLPFPRRRHSRRAALPPHVIVARAAPPPRSRRRGCVAPPPPSCRRASTSLAPSRHPCLHLARPAAPPVLSYATSLTPSVSLAPLLCLTPPLLTLRLHLAGDVAPASCLRLSRRRASTSLAPLRPCCGSATLGPPRLHLGHVATPAPRLRLPRAATPPPRSHRLRAPPRRTGRRRL
jgi:hypothetical protein